MRLVIPESEIEITAVRAAGAGGQNIQKVSSAVHLRFDIAASSLPAPVRARLLALRDHRVTREGVIVIKSQQHRTREQNRAEALRRLHDLVNRAAVVRKARRPTAPTAASRARRLEAKLRRGRLKAARARLRGDSES